ncbi:HAMP domain-containing sensor histidine kinase [Paracidobacterium acidisoli]|uniref:histidine kinase n=1 Tax=Paracidobacterium acidisoli TaxID=2303751 RepID=A0A372INC4_9BACT|nr:HAMP domain-containing sensor histidine kinase [Paracidobacterium acidisoli]MBT9332045.1 HAMP domain-containing histidine kinase [Paracidobacterium acidisoli]
MRIFARIFLTFWCMIVVSIGMTVVFALSTISLLQPLHPRSLPIYPIHTCALAAQDEYERAGLDGLAHFLGTSRTNCSGGIVVNLKRDHLFGDIGPKLATVESTSGQPSPEMASVTVIELPFQTIFARPGPLGKSAPGFILLMRSPYAFFLNSPRSLRTSLLFLLSRIALLIAVSGFCCYLLTLYLVKPVLRLGRMAEQLGGGDLGTRIEGPLIARRDELGELGRKFNQMAGEIDSLVTRYKHFLAHASHELGSPLTRVNIALGLARKKANQALQPELNRIGHETKRLNTLVQELLLLARLESGNELTRQTTSFNIASVVDEACADASFEAAEIGKSIQIQRREDFKVKGHPELLRRALDNVLRNSLRFARERGVIKVDLTRKPGDSIGVISIEDDGPGIEAAQQEIIFDPFITLPNHVIGESEGSGLGLAIARQAVLANRGKISARNGVTGGLAVFIELPIVESGNSTNSI